MGKEIKDIQLSFQCPFEWEKLQSKGTEKFCDSCKNKVFDFSDKDETFLKETLRINSHVCGRFSSKQLSPSFLKHSAALLFITTSLGLNACAQEPNVPFKETNPPPQENLDLIMGIIIEQMPVLEVSFAEFHRIVMEKIRFPQTFPEGKVYVKFVVDTLGAITKPEIVKGLTPKVDEEVLRAFQNLGVKFKPAKRAGKLVETNYVMPVVFRKEE